MVDGPSDPRDQVKIHNTKPQFRALNWGLQRMRRQGSESEPANGGRHPAAPHFARTLLVTVSLRGLRSDDTRVIWPARWQSATKEQSMRPRLSGDLRRANRVEVMRS